MTPSALLVSLAVAAPTLYGALVTGSVPTDVALERLLIILVVTGLVWAGLGKLLQGFAQSAQRARAADPANSGDSGDLPRQERRRP